MRPHRIIPAITGLVLVAGCGSAPEPVGPTGVDGLRIPTPSPSPGDFVSGVTNPWLAWSPGTTWEYATSDRRGRPATYTVTIREATVPVASVATTAAEGTLVRDGTGDVLATDTTYAAQDRGGNVWLFGRDRREGADDPRTWRAGTGGASAGMIMPAAPRVGDGFVVGDLPGRSEERLSVLDLAANPPEQVRADTTALLLERRAPSESDDVAREYYQRGTGLVARDGNIGAGNDLTLIERSPLPH